MKGETRQGDPFEEALGGRGLSEEDRARLEKLAQELSQDSEHQRRVARIDELVKSGYFGRPS